MIRTLDDIATALAAAKARTRDIAGNREAVVAMLLREARHGLEMLLIERARHPADPWSGQIALPGGRREPGDADLDAAARREVREEVNVDLGSARLLSRLDDQPGRLRGRDIGLTVSCLVYAAPAKIRPRPNEEVSRLLWTPLSDLVSPERRTTFQVPYRREPYPAIRLREGPFLWGLTLRFVNDFLARASITWVP